MAPPKSRSRRIFDIAVGIAAILALIFGIPAAINETKKLGSGHDDAGQKAPVTPPVNINQGDNKNGTQIGQITGGTVTINQNKEAKPSVDPEKSPTNKVFALTGIFAKPDPPSFGPPNPPKPLNYYVAGVVSATYIPKAGDSPWLTVCFIDGTTHCFNNTAISLNPGTFDYKYVIYEPDNPEWSLRKSDSVMACIGDAKRINDYFAMSAENQAMREQPACLKKDFDRPAAK